jgi:hypothetical protein
MEIKYSKQNLKKMITSNLWPENGIEFISKTSPSTVRELLE